MSKRMKILRMTLRKEPFEMIKSGIKKEEYREIKNYWLDRFRFDGSLFKLYHNQKALIPRRRRFLNIPDIIIFTNGYRSDSPSLAIWCTGIKIGTSKKKWLGDGGECIVISLGDLLTYSEIKRFVPLPK